MNEYARGPDAALLNYNPVSATNNEQYQTRQRSKHYGSSASDARRNMSWFRAFFEYLGISRWPRGVIIMQLVLMVVLFLCEGVYYLVGSFRFRDEHVGIWHICFLVMQLLLVGSYMFIYFVASRWYYLWDATVRTTAHDIVELNITIPLLTATLSAIQIIALYYLGVTLDLSIVGPHEQTLVAYRQVNFMCGICAAILCYVAYHCTPAFTRKAPSIQRWVVQSAGGADTSTQSGVMRSMGFGDAWNAPQHGDIKQL